VTPPEWKREAGSETTLQSAGGKQATTPTARNFSPATGERQKPNTKGKAHRNMFWWGKPTTQLLCMERKRDDEEASRGRGAFILRRGRVRKEKVGHTLK